MQFTDTSYVIVAHQEASIRTLREREQELRETFEEEKHKLEQELESVKKTEGEWISKLENDNQLMQEKRKYVNACSLLKHVMHPIMLYSCTSGSY